MEGIKATGMTKQQQNGVPILIAVICFFVYWLTASPTPKVEMQEPSKDLIEQVASVKESMQNDSHESHEINSVTIQPSGNSGQFDHIPEATKMVPNSSKTPNSLSLSDQHENAKPEILMFTGRNCPPCEKWKRTEMQQFIDSGWSVGIVEVHRFTITPTFEITKTETVTHQGYLTFKQAEGMLK